MERTLAIIKPDAVVRSLIGYVLVRAESGGLVVTGLRLMRLTYEQAESFYEVHKTRPFFKSLCEFMSSGPVVVAVLEGEGAIARWREIMGATNPDSAAPWSLRAQIGIDVEQNSVHGSDSAENAAREITFFFGANEIIPPQV